jgi:2-polyprenyl-6-methoxyphenol hydroxylase-like FAD-dependent oxidoreductase
MPDISGTRVLVSGASIAGGAVAHWLTRYGCSVLVVERAPGPRNGGQNVDFKGTRQIEVLERMGVLEELRGLETGGSDVVITSPAGRPVATLPGEFTGGDLEVGRGDLARVLHDSVGSGCDYLFDDSVVSLRQEPDGVRVSFERAPEQIFDLVVGADGIHSNVRRLAFGPEERYLRFLGYHYALVDAPGLASSAGSSHSRSPAGPGLMYNEPGRMVTTGSGGEPAFFVFASERPHDRHAGSAQRRRLLAEAYSGAGGEMARMVGGLPDTADPHIDTISRVEMDSFTRGRVALVGDAGYGNTLGGFGSGLSVVGAYVLAGELLAADGDHRVAHAAYDRIMSGYAKVARRGNAGRFLAPRTRRGIVVRDALFRFRPLRDALMRSTDDFADAVELRDYPALLS